MCYYLSRLIDKREDFTKNRIYFGHPINTYNTELETRLLKSIAFYFEGFEIENPNQPVHQEGYKKWKEVRGNGMDYYYMEVLPSCSAGVFLPFRDNKWGAGIFGEAGYLEGLGRPIFEISHNGFVRRVFSLNEVRSLTIKETRRRTKTKDGKIVPY